MALQPKMFWLLQIRFLSQIYNRFRVIKNAPPIKDEGAEPECFHNGIILIVIRFQISESKYKVFFIFIQVKSFFLLLNFDFRLKMIILAFSFNNFDKEMLCYENDFRIGLRDK